MNLLTMEYIILLLYQNWTNNRWYEFDDQYVTEVSPETVAKCEAYVLFYKKTNTEMTSRRHRTVELMQVRDNRLILIMLRGLYVKIIYGQN